MDTNTHLHVRMIYGKTFYRDKSGDAWTVDDGDNDGHHQAIHELGGEQITQTEYWMAKLQEARIERDRRAIGAILTKDEFCEKPEGQVAL